MKRLLIPAALLIVFSLSAPLRAQSKESLKIIFHVDSPDVRELEMAFHNAHSVEMHAGKGDVRMVVVVNGPAVKFLLKGNNSGIDRQVHRLVSTGEVSFHVCETSLKAFHYKTTDVLGDCVIVPAGVIDIADLEASGYAYIKP